MKKLLSLVFLGLFLLVLGCEKDETFQSEVEINNASEIVGAVEQGQDIVGDLGPVEEVADRVDRSRSVETDGCDFTLSPDYVAATLLPGESMTETKEACVEIPPIADILFSFDLTGSMGAELAKVKSDCESIATAIRDEVDDCQAGVVSHMDYPGYHSSCSYSSNYGGETDYPYSLDQALTNDNLAVKAAVNGLSLGYGADHPESYARVFYETYNDAGIGWRPEAAKYVVAFLDAVPHDCNVAGVSYGEDPVVAAAGLDFYDVLDGMDAAGIHLVVIYSGMFSSDWNWWKSLEASYPVTAYRINADGSIPGGMDIAGFIIGAIKGSVPDVGELSLIPYPAEFTSWVNVDPIQHYGVSPGTTVDFEVSYTVPMGTPGEEYIFEMQLWGDDTYYASQEVKIEWIDVPLDIKPTSCPNPLNTRSGGVLPVAIMGSVDFDVTTIDPESILLEGVEPKRYATEDVGSPYFPLIGKEEAYDCSQEGPDGLMDMTMKFNKKSIIEAIGPVSRGDVITLQLTALTYDGIKVNGEDVMIIVK